MGFSLKSIGNVVKKAVDPFGITDSLFGGGGKDEESIARPKYYTDPIYTETQGKLKDFGLGLMEGKVPDYYKPIGETGSKEFENMLGLTTRDIQKSAAEASAASGRARGGNLPAITAGAVADAATKARYSDYNRSLAGKQDLLNLGVGTTTGVRGAAQLEGARTNDFNWKDYSAQVQERAYQDAKEAQEDAELGQMIGTIASIGLGAATGGMSFGMQGALAGAGDVLTGGGIGLLDMVSKNPRQKSAGVSSMGSISDDLFVGGGRGYTNDLFSLS